eukprot:scaffold138367_cov18-Tisochrysis_lutea.AAC.2
MRFWHFLPTGSLTQTHAQRHTGRLSASAHQLQSTHAVDSAKSAPPASLPLGHGRRTEMPADWGSKIEFQVSFINSYDITN